MPDLIVHNLDEHVHAQLHELAKSQGQTTDEFIADTLRAIAQKSRKPSKGIATRMAELFSEIGLTGDETIPEFKGEAVRSPDFSR